MSAAAAAKVRRNPPRGTRLRARLSPRSSERTKATLAFDAHVPSDEDDVDADLYDVQKDKLDTELEAIDRKHAALKKAEERAVRKYELHEQKLAEKRTAAKALRDTVAPAGLVIVHARQTYHSSDESKPKSHDRKRKRVPKPDDTPPAQKAAKLQKTKFGLLEGELADLNKEEQQFLELNHASLLASGVYVVARNEVSDQGKKPPTYSQATGSDTDSESDDEKSTAQPIGKAYTSSAAYIAADAAQKAAFSVKFAAESSKANAARAAAGQPPLSGKTLLNLVAAVRYDTEVAAGTRERGFAGSHLQPARSYARYSDAKFDAAEPAAAAAAAGSAAAATTQQ